MGQTHSTPTQQQTPATGQEQPAAAAGTGQRYANAQDAFDAIEIKLRAAKSFREHGIDYACNLILQGDPPSLSDTLLKSGLKLALATAAGAVGAFTGGLGWVALGAIGLGFGLAGEAVDAVFTDSAPQGVESFRLKRKNVLERMIATELEQVRQNLNSTRATPTDWERAVDDYTGLSQLKPLQDTEVNATADAWMNGLGAQTGTGDLNDATTGRLHLHGVVSGQGSNVRIRVTEASLQGINNSELANTYLNRRLSDVGCYITFSAYLNGSFNAGGLGWQSGNNSISIEGSDAFNTGLGYLTRSDGPAFVSPDHDYSQDAQEGATKIRQSLDQSTLASKGVSSIAVSGV